MDGEQTPRASADEKDGGNMSPENQELSDLHSHAAALVLDLAYCQYPVQWQRLGNMQQSASSILTLISIVAALIIGIILQTPDLETTIRALGAFEFSFFGSLILVFIYLLVSLIYVFLLLMPKKSRKIVKPSIVLERLKCEVNGEFDRTKCYRSSVLFSEANLIGTLDAAISEIDEILVSNHRLYSSCLVSSGFSLLSSMVVLLHLSIRIIKMPGFLLTIVGLVAYALALGIPILILMPFSRKGRKMDG